MFNDHFWPLSTDIRITGPRKRLPHPRLQLNQLFPRKISLLTSRRMQNDKKLNQHPSVAAVVQVRIQTRSVCKNQKSFFTYQYLMKAPLPMQIMQTSMSLYRLSPSSNPCHPSSIQKAWTRGALIYARMTVTRTQAQVHQPDSDRTQSPIPSRGRPLAASASETKDAKTLGVMSRRHPFLLIGSTSWDP